MKNRRRAVPTSSGSSGGDEINPTEVFQGGRIFQRIHRSADIKLHCRRLESSRNAVRGRGVYKPRRGRAVFHFLSQSWVVILIPFFSPGTVDGVPDKILRLGSDQSENRPRSRDGSGETRRSSTKSRLRLHAVPAIYRVLVFDSRHVGMLVNLAAAKSRVSRAGSLRTCHVCLPSGKGKDLESLEAVASWKPARRCAVPWILLAGDNEIHWSTAGGVRRIGH